MRENPVTLNSDQQYQTKQISRYITDEELHILRINLRNRKFIKRMWALTKEQIPFDSSLDTLK